MKLLTYVRDSKQGYTAYIHTRPRARALMRHKRSISEWGHPDAYYNTHVRINKVLLSKRVYIVYVCVFTHARIGVPPHALLSQPSN